MPTFDTMDGLRAMIVSTATQQAMFGAHYINGSDGGITGMNAAGEAGGGLSASRKIYLLETIAGTSWPFTPRSMGAASVRDDITQSSQSAERNLCPARSS